MRSSLLIFLTLLSLLTAFPAVAVVSKQTSAISQECVVDLNELSSFSQNLPGVSPVIRPRKTVAQFKVKGMVSNRDFENENQWRFWSNARPSKVTYFKTDQAREKYRIFASGGLLYHSDGRVFDTKGLENYLFIMDIFGNFYAGEGRDYFFQHSSFLAGKEVAAAGLITVTKGKLLVLKHWTGHYQTTASYFTQAAFELYRDGINLEEVDFIPFSPDRLHNPPALRVHQLPSLP